jgi:hypothetical protein
MNEENSCKTLKYETIQIRLKIYMTKETIREATKRGIKVHLYKDNGTYILDIPQADQYCAMELEPLAAGTDIEKAIDIFEKTLQFLKIPLEPMFLYSMIETLIFREIYGIPQPTIIEKNGFIQVTSPKK